MFNISISITGIMFFYIILDAKFGDVLEKEGEENLININGDDFFNFFHNGFSPFF